MKTSSANFMKDYREYLDGNNERLFKETDTKVITKDVFSKGVDIRIESWNDSFSDTINIFVVALGDYIHKLELYLEDNNLSFWWQCDTKNGETIEIVDYPEYVNDLNELKYNVLTSKYLSCVDDDGYYQHNDALKEIIIIMEQVFAFDPSEH